MSIHPAAIIHPTAKIDPTAEIGPNAVVEEDSVIGPRCRLWPNAFVGKWTTMGEGNELHPGAVVGHQPQDLKFKGEKSFTRIGNFNTFREYSNTHRGNGEGTATVIGNRCLIMATAHIAHNCHLGNEVILANGALLAGHVVVEDRAFISGNSVVHQFCRIGRYAMMSGVTGVSKDIPPFMIVDGINSVGGINIVGLKRAGFSPATRKAIKEAYKILYRSGLNFKNAVDQIGREVLDPEVQSLIRFIRESKRGICRHRGVGIGRRDSGASAEEETADVES